MMIYNSNLKNNIEFVKLFLMPFINSKDQDRVSTFENMYIDGLVFLNANLNNKELFEYASKEDKYLDNINQLHSFIYKMLSIALIDTSYKKYYPEETINAKNDKILKMNDFEESIKMTLTKLDNSLMCRWRGRGDCYTQSFFKNADYNIFDEIKTVLINILVVLFESRDMNSDYAAEGTIEQIGYLYFAFCQKCGKFFYKKREDQVFCSKKCKNAAASQKYRDKSKSSD